MSRVILGNVRGRDGEKGNDGARGEKGDRGTSLRFRGRWTAGVQYQNTSLFIDVVFYRGSSFYCKNTITSANAPDVDTTNWGKIANGVTRIYAELDINYNEFSSYDGNRYYASYHFPQGTFPSYATPHFIMDSGVQRSAGIRFEGITLDVAILSCADRSAITDTTGKLYADLVVTEVVTPL